MSVARAKVRDRLVSIRHAVSDFKLQDLALTPVNASHNTSVRIIRNGLLVQCFNILEDFAKARIAECLNDISVSPVQFRHLPEALQCATTIDSVRAIDYQVKLLDKDNAIRIAYVQKYGAILASTIQSKIELADIAFFHSTSNISKDQFRDALKAFSVDKPWDQVSGFSSRLNLSAVPAETVFVSLANRRNDAAHNASAAISEGDLLQSLTDAFGLAIGFDVMLSKATQSLVALTASPPSTFRSVTDQTQIPVRFIKATSRGFSEVKEGSTHNIRTDSTYEALIPAASTRASRENGVLVVYDSSGSVVEWHL